MVWDLPLDYSKQEIKRLVKSFGTAEEIRLQKQKYYQIAEMKIYTKYEEQNRK
jgi:hypothetical protein